MFTKSICLGTFMVRYSVYVFMVPFYKDGVGNNSPGNAPTAAERDGAFQGPEETRREERGATDKHECTRINIEECCS